MSFNQFFEKKGPFPLKEITRIIGCDINITLYVAIMAFLEPTWLRTIVSYVNEYGEQDYDGDG